MRKCLVIMACAAVVGAGKSCLIGWNKLITPGPGTMAVPGQAAWWCRMGVAGVVSVPATARRT